MANIPIEIPSKSTILVVGAGGGFDFLCGLPIVIELENRGHQVYIANYSFTSLSQVINGNWHSKKLLEINADSYLKEGDYFPESYLSKWYREENSIEKSIWCLSPAGVIPTLESYNYIIEKHDIDIVFCIDGGVDGIFRGDEFDLGTPSMDSISVIAASLSKASIKIYVCSAFGAEGAEGNVSHAQVLNRIADLIKMDAFLGIGSIRRNCTTGLKFMDAVDFIYQHLDPMHQSIIISSIMASMEGEYGRTVVHEKTRVKQPWISPLTSLIWYFNAEPVAKMKLFYEHVLNSSSVEEVLTAINSVREKFGIKEYESIPI